MLQHRAGTGFEQFVQIEPSVVALTSSTATLWLRIGIPRGSHPIPNPKAKEGTDLLRSYLCGTQGYEGFMHMPASIQIRIETLDIES
ncbi:hypothetical protein V6N13_027799 [Hibiscus sabdariffa]